MIRKILFLFIVIQFQGTIVAQEIGFQVGYAIIGRSYLYSGIDFRVTEKSCVNIGAGTYLAVQNQKITALPEIHFNMIPLKKHNASIFNHTFMAEISATTKSVNPSVGINILNFLKIKSGYAYPYNQLENFKGFTFGINLSFGSKDYMDRIKMF